MSKIEEKKFERILSTLAQIEYGVSRTTLWRWEKKGLVAPVGRVGKGGQKVYLRKDIETVQASML